MAGPTASGKSTIAELVSALDPNLYMSISTTTRAPRLGEQEGVDYYFVNRDEFKERVEAGKFIEWAEYSGNLYGTEIRNIDYADSSSKDMLLDLEVQGVKQLKEIYPKRLVCIFIFPVSFEVLEARLKNRGSESEAQITKRLSIAKEEVKILEDSGFSNYKVVNKDLKDAVEEVREIIAKERGSS